MSSASNSRKTQHVELALRPDSQMASPHHRGFDAWQFEPLALPEADLDSLECSTDFMNKRLSWPFMVSSMTGGGEYGAQVNAHLAEACEAQGVALAVGSQRIGLDDGAAKTQFELRRLMPKGCLLGNLGATQLLEPNAVDRVQRAIDMLEADAFYIHLNPLQECAQPGGDRDWLGVAQQIEAVCKASSVPIIAKEVGHGIGPTTAGHLADLGVAAIDVAGTGGTSWCQIEINRNPDPIAQQVLAPFASWGMSTAMALQAARQALPGGYPLIASGGVRHGLDVAKAEALGACLGAAARPFLEVALESTEAVETLLDVWFQQYRLAKFLGGVLLPIEAA